MFDLPLLERHLFFGILLLTTLTALMGYVQIVREQVQFRRHLISCIVLQVALGAVILVLRAVAIGAFPITDVFESMLALIVFIGITSLWLSVYMRQVWFLSVMGWGLFVISWLSAVVAKPALELQDAVRTPWVIFHALSMALSGAMVVFAASMSVLYLWSRQQLKTRQFLRLFGKMPNIEKLEKMNLLGLQLSFAALTLGLISGIGLAGVKSAGLGMAPADWLTDSKIVLIIVSWFLLLVTLILRRLLMLNGKIVAQTTLFICFLILFAFIGSKLFCKSSHDFGNIPARHSLQIETRYAYCIDRD